MKTKHKTCHLFLPQAPFPQRTNERNMKTMTINSRKLENEKSRLTPDYSQRNPTNLPTNNENNLLQKRMRLPRSFNIKLLCHTIDFVVAALRHRKPELVILRKHLLEYLTMGQTNRGRQERVWARGGINILPPNDHQKITQIILHMYVGLPGPLQTSYDPMRLH